MANVVEIIIKGVDEVSKTVAGSTASLQKMGKNMMKVGGAMTVGMTVPIVAGFNSMINAAMESESELAELNAVLESTKGVSGMTAEALMAQADALQQVTKFGDEAIIGGQSMLLTFTNIGKEVFPDATVAMLNMAEKFGSVEQASMQLGKALNDPVLGVSALRRVGIQLSETQEQQIKDFVEVGNVAAAQKIILGELETQFGGLAEAAGQTTAGQMEIMKNQLGELSEELGRELIPLLIELLPHLIELIRSFREASPEAKRTVLAVMGVVAALGPLLTTVGGAITLFSSLSGTVLPAVGAALGAISLPVLALIGAVGLLIFTIIKFGDDAWNTVNMVREIILAMVQKAIWALGSLGGAFEGIANGIQKVFYWVVDLQNKLLGLKIPSWLTPGSPTPFELGLRGIGDAMAEISRKELPKFSAGLDLNPQAGSFAYAGAGAGAGGSPVIVQLQYSPTVSLLDRSEAEMKLIPYIEAALRKVRYG